MELREKFKKETECSVMAYRQDYGGQRPYEDGFCDEYVKWLESKVKNLSLCAVSQRSELLKAFIKDADNKGNIILIESEQKCIEDFSL